MYAFINKMGSEHGKFVFVKLENGLDFTPFDMDAWMKDLSENHYDNLPIVVGNEMPEEKRQIVTWPKDFPSQSVAPSWMMLPLTSVKLPDLPPKTK